MAKTYNLKSASIEELVNLEKACMVIYSKLQNEAMALRGQTTPYNIENELFQLEREGNKYNKIHDRILDEIKERLENITGNE